MSASAERKNIMAKVTMYTLSTCPWCRKTKKWFTEHQIPFEFTDYDLADEAMQGTIMHELDAAGANGFPFVRIGDQVVVGYQPEVYAKLMGV
jgi:glutaredoxin